METYRNKRKDRSNRNTALRINNANPQSKEYSNNNSPKDDAQSNPSQTYLLSLLESLEFVEQNPHYHPEGDALYHSLQTFEIAYSETTDPELWTAALFHDIGKSVDNHSHAVTGASFLQGIFSARVIWLIEHHMDLLKHPARTRKRLCNSQALHDLEKLRKWDLNGRQTNVDVCPPEQAIKLIAVII